MLRLSQDIPTTEPPGDLPAAPSRELAEAIGGRKVIAHAEFDLDEWLRYAKRFVLLAGEDTSAAVIFSCDKAIRQVSLRDLAGVEIEESLGVDRLILRERQEVGGRRHALPFSRRHRLEMTRFHQKLRKRLDHDAGPDLAVPPDESDFDEATFDAARPKVLLRLLEVAQPYRTRIWIAMVLTALVGVVQVIPVWLTKYVIDESINPQTTGGMTFSERVSSLIFWCSLYFASIVVQMVLFGTRLRLLSFVGTHVARDLRVKVYAHLHRLSMRYFGKHRVGSLITRVTSDTDRLWDFIVFGSVDYARNVLMMAAATFVMFYVNWQLATIALIPVPFVATLTWYKSHVMHRMFSRLWTYWSRLTAVVGDSLPGVKVVKAFAGEGREIDRFARRNDAFSADELATINVWVNLQPIVEGTMMLSRVLILAAGGYFIIRAGDDVTGGNTLGTLIMFLTVVGFYHMAIADMVQKQRIVTRAATSAQRVFEVLDTPVEIDSKPDALRPERVEGFVTFENVSFSYDGTKPVLRHVNLDVGPGQMIGLCGHSGAGKSTFVNLVSRFYDVSDGRILIDGQDIREYDLHWLRSNVGVVLQDPYLFHGTIADNVRYGKPEASMAEVVTAARAANAHDFISQLPDAYDTMVGERGQSLSGGERQRVSIARAILHNPKILVLDEATSSVDTKTERQIQEALDRLMEGRTTFAIAHRLSTLRDADKIVVLDKGSIIETGTHEELLERGEGGGEGAYAKLFQAQAEIAADMLVEA